MKNKNEFTTKFVALTLALCALLSACSLSSEKENVGKETQEPTSTSISDIDDNKSNLKGKLFKNEDGLYVKLKDFSSNDNDINWDEVEKTYSAVVLRSNHGFTDDLRFNELYDEASKRGLQIGYYCYNEIAMKELSDLNLEKYAERQALTTIEQIKDKKIDLPVFLYLEDIRLSNGKSYNITDLSSAQLNIILDTWYEVISANGYVPGVSGPANILNIIQQKTFNGLDKFSIWKIEYGKENDYPFYYYAKQIEEAKKVKQAIKKSSNAKVK